MNLVKYIGIFIAGIVLGLSFGAVFNKNAALLSPAKSTNPVVPENILNPNKKIDDSQKSENLELLSQIEELIIENEKLETKLNGIQGLIGTLDKNSLSNLIDKSTLENRYLNESNLDDDFEFESALKSYIKERPIEEQNLLDDFLATRSPSVEFDKVKNKIFDHLDDEKDVDWAYQTEEFLSKYFKSNTNEFTVLSIICLNSSCEIIGAMQNYNTSKPETDIAIMERELEFSERLEPIFISLINDQNYFGLLTDRVYGPYFSILENYNKQTIPFVLYIDRSARSQIPVQ